MHVFLYRGNDYTVCHSPPLTPSLPPPVARPGTKNSHIRLAFSFEPADKIEQAIERLGRALRAWKERTSAQ